MLTGRVVMTNVALSSPARIATVPGTIAAALLLRTLTERPPAGCGARQPYSALRILTASDHRCIELQEVERGRTRDRRPNLQRSIMPLVADRGSNHRHRIGGDHPAW
jgi:hypothetical protein